MPRFYTQTGDDGYTSLLGEGRVAKYSPRLEAVGALDEASAALGLARAMCQSPEVSALILSAQRDLYRLMAEVAATPANAERFRAIDSERIHWLEEQTDNVSHKVILPSEFTVPGDSQAGAALALARTIIRRAERRVAWLVHNRELENIEILRYINRLSSFCYALEMLENQVTGKQTPTLAKE